MVALAIRFKSPPLLVLNDMVPINGIIPFFDIIANIPSNYVLCDGNNGTPDMLLKYPRGALNDSQVGSFFGTQNHSHTFDGDGHEHSANSTHDCPGSGVTPAATLGPGMILTDEQSVEGITDVEANLPPSVGLHYIMRVS